MLRTLWRGRSAKDVRRCRVAVLVEPSFLHKVPPKSPGVAVDTHRQDVGLHQLAGKQPLCFDAVLVTLSTRRRPARDLAAASQAASCSGMASSEVRKRIIYAGGEGRGWPSKLRLKICGLFFLETCVEICGQNCGLNEFYEHAWKLVPRIFQEFWMPLGMPKKPHPSHPPGTSAPYITSTNIFG